MPAVLTASTTNNWQCAQPFERRHTCQVPFQRGQYTHLSSVFPSGSLHSLAQCLSSEGNTLTCQVSLQRGQYTHLPSVFPASPLSASISVPSPANAAKCGRQCRKFSCRCFSAPQIVDQTNTGTVSEATVVKLLRDTVESMTRGFSVGLDTILN